MNVCLVYMTHYEGRDKVTLYIEHVKILVGADQGQKTMYSIISHHKSTNSS